MSTTNQELTAAQKQNQLIKVKQQNASVLLHKYKDSFAQALPRHLTADRLIRVALTAMTVQPKLLDCTTHSLIAAVMTAGQLGLMPDSVLGECYFIPFKNTKKNVTECQIVIGYKGLCGLAMRSGMVKSVQARAVYMANENTPEGEKGDEFIFELGLDEKLKHIPNGLKDPQYITHFYAIVKFNNGGHVLDVMTREQVNKIRDESKNYQYAVKDGTQASTMWVKYFAEMGSKTVLRRLMKYVPLSPELQKAVSLDEAADEGKQKLSVEILNDPATDDEMRDAIDAEYQDDYNQEQQEQADAQQKQKDEKVDAANAQLKSLLDKKKPGQANSQPAG